MNKKLIVTSALTSVLMVSAAANAKTINYNVLESIFGEPVTTSATGKPQRASEAPASMEIITREDILKSKAEDIPQLLRKFAGVEVTRGSITGSDVSIRGFNTRSSNRILVLLNGRQLSADSYGAMYWNHMPIQMNEIQQIEVVRGPNSSLFGFNAEAGVINIVTVDPLNMDIDEVQARVGNYNRYEVNGVTTQRLRDDMGIRLSAGYVESDGFENNHSNQRANQNPETDNNDEVFNRSVAADYLWQIDSDRELRVEGSMVLGDAQNAVPYDSAGAGQDLGALKIAYSHNTDKHGLVTATAYHTTQDAKGFGMQVNLTSLKLENLRKLNAQHSLRVGTEYRKTNFSGQFAGSQTFDYSVIGANAMWDWQIDDAWSFTNAIRFDHLDSQSDTDAVFGPMTTEDFNQTHSAIAFNSSLVYKMTDKDRFRATVARGQHLPSLVEMGSHVSLLGGALGFYGDPYIQPEELTSYELAYNRALPEYQSNFKASIFHQSVEDVIVPEIDLNGFTPQYYFANGGKVENYGLELTLDGTHKGIDWMAAYTFMAMEDKAVNNRELHFEGSQPKHQFSLAADYDINSKWNIGGDFHYVSAINHRREAQLPVGAPSLVEERIEDRYILNLKGIYQWDDMTELSLTGRNLIDNYRDWGYRENATLGNSATSTIGTTFLFGVRRQF